ncbi:MAG TPA: hypothetical protein VFM78_06375 [Marinobacter sp.]|nr:hypothetical protein [Marinobacter sp.]
MTAPSTRTLMFVPVFASLVACGGSDNDGRSVREEPLTLDPQGYANRAAVIRSLSDFESVDRTYEDMAAVYRLLDEAEAALMALAEAPPTGDDSESDVNLGQRACDEDRNNLLIQRTELADGGFIAQFDFDDCRLTIESGELELTGFIQLERRVSGTDLQISESYGLTGSVFPGGAELGLNGTLSASVNATGDDTLTIAVKSRTLEFLYGSRYAAFRDADILVQQTGEQVTLDVSTQLIGSFLQGYLNLSTPETVTGDLSGSCPERGHLRAVGDGTLDLRFGTSTARGTGSELLVNGSDVEFSDSCPSVLPVPSASLLFLISK